MPAAFESARAKITRARRHLDQLSAEIKADASKRYGVSFRHELRTDELVLSALMPHDLFVNYSIVAGEIISHARSALDHAVWELTPVADRSKQTAFPVLRFEKKTDRTKGTEPYYDNDCIRKIRGLSAKAAAIIKAAQPFGPNYQTNEMYILNELWNTDKHQLLNSCASYTDFIALTEMPLPLGSAKASQRFIGVPRDIEDGTELLREPYRRDVKLVAEHATTGVIFRGGPADGKRVPELLSSLIELSDQTVEALAKTI